MPFVLTFREGTGPLRKPFRHGAVVAMRVNGHTYGATLNLPAGVKTAAIRIPDDLPVSFALGKRVFLREGDRWEATSHKSARVYEVPATDALSESVVGSHELPFVPGVEGQPTEGTFVFKWAEMSEAARKSAVDSLKGSRRQQRRPRPYPALLLER